MTAPWHKVVRDIWHERTRASLVILAIAVGLTGFLAVLSTYAILRRELDRGYLATNPASAVIFTDDVDDALIAATIARDDVADAEARRVVSGRIQTPDGSWRRLRLFVVRDFNRLHISTVRPEAGAWPPATGEMLIERDAFQVGKTGIGAMATVETTAGQHALLVAGRVHDAGQAQARMENMVYGYIAPSTLEVLGEHADLDRLYVMASGNRFDEARVRQIASDLKAWLEGSGHVVRRVDVPTPGQHPHAVIMSFLLLLMDAFGAFALALSGVIVANLLLAMLAAEHRQIGIMKALGGSRSQIARLYLAEAGILGLGALIIAVPAGVVAAGALSRYFAVLLNFDLNSLAIPLWVFSLAVLIAVIVPLGAAAYPVAVATDITVREALDASGINATTFGVSRLDRLSARMLRGASPLMLGIRNCLRRRTRTALTLSTLACAGTFFMSALNVRGSLMTSADRQFGAGTYGADFRYAFDQHMLMIYVFLIIVAAVLASIGGLGLTTATSLNVLERRRELGVLRAIGAPPVTVAAIVVSESLFIAGAAWIIAVGAAWAVAIGIGSIVPRVNLFKNGLNISVSAVGIVGWLGLSAAMAIAASVTPAIAAGRRSIREAISHE